jgi:hypothetical protein
MSLEHAPAVADVVELTGRGRSEPHLQACGLPFPASCCRGSWKDRRRAGANTDPSVEHGGAARSIRVGVFVVPAGGAGNERWVGAEGTSYDLFSPLSC